MKIRLVIILLCLLTAVTSVLGGYFYYNNFKNMMIKNYHDVAEKWLSVVAGNMDNRISEIKNIVKNVSEFKEIKNTLINPDNTSINTINVLLDYCRASTDASVCYIMDINGNTLASSNRNDDDSFVGKNYSFRPYFKEALESITSVYMAVGVTSNLRGIYFSHAVYNDLSEAIGVFVVKMSIELIDAQVSELNMGVLSLIDPNSMIFVSTNEDWLLKFLYQPDTETIKALSESKQFGEGPWEWINIEQKGNDFIELDGQLYLMHQKELSVYPGWKLIYLHNHSLIEDVITGTLFQSTGIILIVLCILIGLIVILLYKTGSDIIAKRKAAENALQKSLKEKELLIKEIHHRTKNNLAVVQSLLSLQLHEVIDNKSRDYLKESQNRVKAISLIHERMYKAENLNSVKASDYIKKISRELFSSYNIQPEHINLELDIDDINLDVDDIVPCGLIINELITNALKYAFPENRNGTLYIKLKKIGGSIELCIRDNGIGLPDNFDITKSDTLGMNLISALTEQLEGRLSVKSDNGAEFAIIFSDKS